MESARGGGVKGMAKTSGENRAAASGAASAAVGTLRVTGATRTKEGVPTAGACGVSQARIEQSFCPGIPIESQLLLSFWRSRDWR